MYVPGEHRNIKLLTNKGRRNIECQNQSIIQKMKRTQILICKTIYVGLAILEISKIVMYAFWYDYVKPELEKKQSYVNWI